LDSLNLLGRRIAVLWVADLKDEEGNLLDGKVSFDEETISIRTGQSPWHARQALLHEIIHLCLSCAGLTQMMTSVHAELEEGVCCALEYGIAQALTSNKELRELFDVG